MKKKKKEELADELLDDLIDEVNDVSSRQDIEDSEIKIEFGQFKGAPPPPSNESLLDSEDIEDDATVQAADDPFHGTPMAEDSAATLQAPPPVERTEKIDLTNSHIPSDSFSLPQSPTFHSKTNMDSKLVESENLKVAKQRIADIEKENERLRIENEELASAAETFRNKVDNLQQRTMTAERKYQDLYESVKVEKELLMTTIREKEGESSEIKEKIKELEQRLQTGVRKIRVRERELENRLELIKMEGKALLKSKDDMILKLKRQIDQVGMELENARGRIQDSTKELNHKQDILRRAVKTLRLALSLLETEEGHIPQNLKKAE